MTTTPTGEPDLVDPRAPRFGQALTATGLLAGLALWTPLPVYAVALVLSIAVLSRWRLDPYGVLWTALGPVVGSTVKPEPAAPHRFAKLLGATFSTAAAVLLVLGFPTAGYAIAGAVAALAGLAAATDVCLGCRLYRQVSFLGRAGVV